MSIKDINYVRIQDCLVLYQLMFSEFPTSFTNYEIKPFCPEHSDRAALNATARIKMDQLMSIMRLKGKIIIQYL